jgi:hypothetical protein
VVGASPRLDLCVAQERLRLPALAADCSTCHLPLR